MKKLYIIALSVLSLAVGCQREEIAAPDTDASVYEVYATTEDMPDTKTYMSGTEVYWSSGDKIAVFYKNTLRKCFDVTPESVASKNATFLEDTDYNMIGSSKSISNNVAYYPFCDVICAAEGASYVLSNISLPAVQNYALGSAGLGAYPMVAVTENTEDVNFRFRNVCGALMFQLKGYGFIRSVSIKGNSDEVLAGSAKVTAAYGKDPELALLSDSEADKTVTIDCGEAGVELDAETPVSFVFSLPPDALSDGFTITVTDIWGGSKEYSTSKANTIFRSKIRRMPAQEYIGVRPPQEGDYIDEYGVNHGQGVEIDGVVWAPVNCGYHAVDYKYGKLYQWGRKYGQGYNGDLYDVDGNKSGTYTDATVPSLNEGPVSLYVGQSEDNADKFYYHSYDWNSVPDGKLWNFGTEDSPVKTEYDPCPEGWRVPTWAELDGLCQHSSPWTTESDQRGYWFSGSNTYSDNIPKIFFLAAGRLFSSSGSAEFRGFAGYYWSSCPNDEYQYGIFFYSNYVSLDFGGTRAYGYPVRCVQDDSELIPVSSVTLDKTSVTMAVGQTQAVVATTTPANANHQSAHWWSDDKSIATVDSEGNITAVSEGTVTITAMAGMKTAVCYVTVLPKPEAQEGDYIDEYGVNHGQGVEIDGVVWAPVNCGYHATDFKYGKLYQWGRKYGQGYKGFDNQDPTIQLGPVNLANGQSQDNKNVFFTSSSDNDTDWLTEPVSDLWNIGDDDNPVRTEYDPCPAGWRVPTYSEMKTLIPVSNSISSQDGINGYWFTGTESAEVFFPVAGYLANDGNNSMRDMMGYYWTSTSHLDGAYVLFDHNYFTSTKGQGFSVRCVQDDSELIPVSSVTLDKTSVTMAVGQTQAVVATITPANANHQSAHWWSDDKSIATVDSEGNITAVSEGTVTITAMAGMQTATCEVTVVAKGSYVDEYGVNHGQGVKIGETVWAPVNCGYHKDNFKYGKLYQWGRKYGQGYSGNIYNLDGNKLKETYSDAIVPTVVSGPVDLTTGQSKDNENIFYNNSSSPYDWLSNRNDALWNSGTEDNPVKTDYDPCPAGWRVPTYAELDELRSNRSSWTTNSDGQIGYWFSGASTYTSDAPQVFFPAAGTHSYDGDSCSSRGDSGIYWSSRPYSTSTYNLRLLSSFVDMMYICRTYGFSVRCVQITD